MPLGDIIADTIGQAVGEFVVYGTTYWTGYVFLSVISLGRLEIAPLSTISERNPDKKKWFQVDWSIWLKRKNKKKALRAETVCLVGTILLIGIGVVAYFAVSYGGANQSMVSTPKAALLP